ncbi:MAG TPA: hypothetical protein VF109_12385 [Mycobacteriales bacterium]
MNNYTITDAATLSVPTQWTGKAAVVRCPVAPVQLKFDGTGLPSGALGISPRISGIGTGAVGMADQVQDVVVDRGVDVPGIAPRGRPVRC